MRSGAGLAWLILGVIVLAYATGFAMAWLLAGLRGRGSRGRH